MVNNVKKILLAIGHEKVENIIKKQISNNPYYNHSFLFSEKPAVYREGLIRMIGQENPDILILRETLQGAIDLSQVIFEIRTTYPLLRIILLTKERPIGDDFLYEMVGVGIYDIINQSTNIDINKIIEMIVTPSNFASVSKYRPAIKETLPNGKKIFDTQGTVVITKENNTPVLTPTPTNQPIQKEEPKIDEQQTKEVVPVQEPEQKVVVVNMEDVMKETPNEPNPTNTPTTESVSQEQKNENVENLPKKDEPKKTGISSIEEERKNKIKQKQIEEAKRQELLKQQEEETKKLQFQEEEEKNKEMLLLQQKKEEEELKKQELVKQQEIDRQKALEEKQKQEEEKRNAKLRAKEEKNRLKQEKREEQERLKQEQKAKKEKKPFFVDNTPNVPTKVESNLPTSTPITQPSQQKNGLFSGLFKGKKNNTNKNMNNTVFNQNKVLSFVGARQGVGTTTLGFNTAIGLAKQGKKVIYIELEQNISALSYWYKFYVENGLESFPKHLRNTDYEKALDCILTSEELHEIDKKNKIYPKTLDMLLFSANYMLNPLSREELSEENINEIITFLLVQLEYEYVIVDCLLSNPQLVNHVLLCSNFTHFVVTQEPLDIALVCHFLQNRRLPLRNYDYVINQYVECNFSYKQINKWLTDAPTIYINNYKGTLIDCNYNGIPIYICGNNDKVKQIQNDINQLFI